MITAHPKRFAHLSSLDLDNNLLEESIPAVKALCRNVVLGEQQDYDDVFEW